MPAFLAESGMPMWNELRTRDFATAVEFYSGLFDWVVDAESTPGYALALSDNMPVAGIIDLTSDDADQERPQASTSAQWMTAFYAPDMTETYRSALTYGATDPTRGSARLSSEDIASITPTVTDGPRGRMVPLVDPSGTPIALIYPPAEPFTAAGEPGTPMWHQLSIPASTDGRKAAHNQRQTTFDFYANVFGWDLMVQGEGDETIATAVVEGAPFASMWFPKPEEVEEFAAQGVGRPHWATFFGVLDAHKAADYARTHGGTVLVEPSESPIGTMLVIADPGGAVITLVEAEPYEEEMVHEGDNIFDVLS